jgi:hypothetical protein
MPAERNNEQRHKPREGHQPYKPRKPKKVVDKNPAKSLAQPLKSRKRSNLTLADWLIIYVFIDEHPNLTQDAIVQHFLMRAV